MLSISVLVLYVCACLWLIASIWRSASPRARHVQSLTGAAVAGLGAVLHGILVYLAVVSMPNLALSMSDTASLMGWIVAIITLIALWQRPRFTPIAVVLLLVAGVTAVITDDGARNYATSQRGWALTTHIIIAIVAYSLIAIGAVFAVALAILDRRLRQHQPLGVMSSLPSVEALEAAMFQTISVGFALLTLTLFSGFIFVQNLFAQHLAHKVILSCIAWVILGVLLLGRWRLGWRGRIAARWALGGFVLLLFAYFGSKFVLEVVLGRHWG